MGSGWCGSVDWMLACGLKGCWFDPQSGHMSELQAGSLVGDVWEATNWYFSLTLMFLSLFFSLPSLSLKINNSLKNKKKEWGNDACCNTDKPWKHRAELRRQTGKVTFCSIPLIISKISNDVASESRSVVRRGTEAWGVWGVTRLELLFGTMKMSWN